METREPEIPLKKQIKEYVKKLPHRIMTNRWNQQTWEENCNFRRIHEHIKCIYCCPMMIAKEIPKDTTLFVLEMNNDTNKIMGIGLIRNRHVMNKYMVYENDRYNRFVYVSKTHISRESMTEEEEEIMKILDKMCFHGNTHLKRGQGIKSFPPKMLYSMLEKIDLVEFMVNMFRSRQSSKTI